MILSTNPKFLFLHIPKTGGSSMQEALYHFLDFEYAGISHATLLNYKHYLDKDLYDSLFKFTTIRNPWDLQVSCWRYFVLPNKIEMSFDEYIKWKFEGSILDMVDRLPRDVEGMSVDFLQTAFYIHRTPLTYWFIDESGNFLVDYILTLERYNEHFKTVCSHLGIDNVFIPKHNVSNNNDEPYQNLYTEETKKIVSKVFSLDIKLFGYDFNSGLADIKKVGYVNETNNSLSKRDIKTSFDLFFNVSNLFFASFGNVKRNIQEDDNQKNEFEKDKIKRRIDSLKENINHINEIIDRLEDEIIENPDDQLILNKNSGIIKEMYDKKMEFRIQISRNEKLIT